MAGGNERVAKEGSPGLAAADADRTSSEAVAEARLAAIAARFGDRWDEEQRAQIRRQLKQQVELGVRLRRTPLGNGDEPEIVFDPAPARRDADGSADR